MSALFDSDSAINLIREDVANNYGLCMHISNLKVSMASSAFKCNLKDAVVCTIFIDER